MQISDILLDAENVSLSVPAGFSLQAVQEYLLPYGLFYPPAVDLAPSGTVGGHLAKNTCGPWRIGRGTARDWVLGLDLVTGSGEVIRTGSGVVKNVAGLDLTKLLIGSRGRLAVITGAHLRLAPLPAERTIISAQFANPAQALVALPPLMGGPLAPTAVELWGSRLLVGLEGTEADLPRRSALARSALQAAGGSLLENPKTLHQPTIPVEAGTVHVKAGLPAGRAHTWVAALPPDTPLHGHAGSGIYHCIIPADPALVKVLSALAQQLNGYVTVDGQTVMPDIQVELETRIRLAFDPDGIFGEGSDLGVS